MSIKEHFQFYATLHKIEITQDLMMSTLALVHLDSININISPNKLSTGERKRFLLAIAILVGKNIIILDEPTASLDKKNIYLLIEILKELSTNGITFIIATHDQQIADVSHVVYRIENKKCVEIKRIKSKSNISYNSKKVILKNYFIQDIRI